MDGRSVVHVLAVLALAILVPILLGFFVPVRIVAMTPVDWTVDLGAARLLAPIAWTMGAATALWAATLFVVAGRGTPTSASPPRDLVVTGLYRWVRNPMYVGGLLVVVGHLFWSGALTLLAYLVVLFLAFHLFIVLYEEPRLRGRFGGAYERYTLRVPRWLPRAPAEREA